MAEIERGYLEITDNEIAIEKPVTNELFTKNRNNPEAIAQGNAPVKVRGRAMMTFPSPVGDGNEGDITYSGSQVIEGDRVHQYENFTIPLGSNIEVESGSKWVVIKVRSLCNILGTLSADGLGGIGSPDGSTPGQNGRYGGAGGNGVDAGGSDGGSVPLFDLLGGVSEQQPQDGDSMPPSVGETMAALGVSGDAYLGGAGGGGGVGGSAPGGNGGGVLVIMCDTLDMGTASALVHSDGHDGTWSGLNVPNGGGGGGGLVVVVARRLIGNGGAGVRAVGGAGGVRPSGPDGGDGGDGVAIVTILDLSA